MVKIKITECVCCIWTCCTKETTRLGCLCVRSLHVLLGRARGLSLHFAEASWFISDFELMNRNLPWLEKTLEQLSAISHSQPPSAYLRLSLRFSVSVSALGVDAGAYRVFMISAGLPGYTWVYIYPQIWQWFSLWQDCGDGPPLPPCLTTGWSALWSVH